MQAMITAHKFKRLQSSNGTLNFAIGDWGLCNNFGQTIRGFLNELLVCNVGFKYKVHFFTILRL